MSVASRRRGVLRILQTRLTREQEFRILGEPIADAARIFPRLERESPRLLLLDERLLDRLDHESARKVHTSFPDIRVLLLCDRESPALVEQIVTNHFHGLLTVTSEPETYAKALRAVDRGELWLPRALLAKAIFTPVRLPDRSPALTQRPLKEAMGRLTRRETQVVDYLRQGLANKEIAVELGIMVDTVKKHLHNVFAKLGIQRRAQLILRRSGSV